MKLSIIGCIAGLAASTDPLEAQFWSIFEIVEDLAKVPRTMCYRGDPNSVSLEEFVDMLENDPATLAPKLRHVVLSESGSFSPIVCASLLSMIADRMLTGHVRGKPASVDFLSYHEFRKNSLRFEKIALRIEHRMIAIGLFHEPLTVQQLQEDQSVFTQEHRALIDRLLTRDDIADEWGAFERECEHSPRLIKEARSYMRMFAMDREKEALAKTRSQFLGQRWCPIDKIHRMMELWRSSASADVLLQMMREYGADQIDQDGAVERSLAQLVFRRLFVSNELLEGRYDGLRERMQQFALLDQGNDLRFTKHPIIQWMTSLGASSLLEAQQSGRLVDPQRVKHYQETWTATLPTIPASSDEFHHLWASQIMTSIERRAKCEFEQLLDDGEKLAFVHALRNLVGEWVVALWEEMFKHNSRDDDYWFEIVPGMKIEIEEHFTEIRALKDTIEQLERFARELGY